MGAEQIRIGIRGRIRATTARSLGGRIEDTPDGFELVVPYVDMAQVTGLLVRLGDLHIPFHHVVVTPIDTTKPNNSNEGATS